jgi:hypothetical protein
MNDFHVTDTGTGPLRREDAAKYRRERYGFRIASSTLAKYAWAGVGPIYRLAGRAAVYEIPSLGRMGRGTAEPAGALHRGIAGERFDAAATTPTRSSPSQWMTWNDQTWTKSRAAQSDARNTLSRSARTRRCNAGAVTSKAYG